MTESTITSTATPSMTPTTEMMEITESQVRFGFIYLSAMNREKGSMV